MAEQQGTSSAFAEAVSTMVAQSDASVAVPTIIIVSQVDHHPGQGGLDNEIDLVLRVDWTYAPAADHQRGRSLVVDCLVGEMGRDHLPLVRMSIWLSTRSCSLTTCTFVGKFQRSHCPSHEFVIVDVPLSCMCCVFAFDAGAGSVDSVPIHHWALLAHGREKRQFISRYRQLVC